MHSNVLSFQELGNSRLLIYKDDVSHLNFKLEMPHVLSIVRTTFVGSPLCYFDVSNLISLNNLQNFTLDKFDLLKVLKVSTQVALECTRQGIGLDELLFDPDYVFVDPQFNSFFIPLRIPGNTIQEIRIFLKNIIANSVIDPKYTDNFVQLLLNEFNGENFSLEKLSTLIDDFLSTKTFQIPENLNMIIEPQNIQEEASDKKDHNDEELSQFLSNHLEEERQKKQVSSSDHPLYNPDKTYPNVLNSGFAPVFSTNHPSPTDTAPSNSAPIQQGNEQFSNQTTPVPQSFYQEPSSMPILENHPQSPQMPTSDPNNVAYMLSAEEPHSPIYISTNPFRIGRNPELVEYVINSPYIGRIHAYIEREGDQYYLSDNKSTNGTFLNTYRIPPEQRVPLKNGDIIRFAKHAFQFVWQPNK